MITFLKLIIIGFLIRISIIDLRTRFIPNNVILKFLLIILMIKGFQGISGNLILSDALGGMFLGAGPYLFFYLITNGSVGIGGGDIKLMGVLGLLLGTKSILLVMFLTTMTAGIGASLALIFGLKKDTDTIPLGPFISIAASILLFLS